MVKYGKSNHVYLCSPINANIIHIANQQYVLSCVWYFWNACILVSEDDSNNVYDIFFSFVIAFALNNNFIFIYHVYANGEQTKFSLMINVKRWIKTFRVFFFLSLLLWSSQAPQAHPMAINSSIYCWNNMLATYEYSRNH